MERKIRNEKLPFEIIEIGAVKVNSKKEITDSFHRLIRPQVYNRIHSSIHEVIHMDYRDLLDGVPFEQAAGEFLEWCGKDWYFFNLGKSGCDGTSEKYEVLWPAGSASRTCDLL